MPLDVTWQWADTSALAVSTGEFCSCSLPFQLCSHSSGPSGRIHAGLPCRVSVSALPQAGSSVQFALLKHDPLFLLNSGPLSQEPRSIFQLSEIPAGGRALCVNARHRFPSHLQKTALLEGLETGGDL